MKNTAQIPASDVINSRLGTLKPKNGYPTDATVEKKEVLSGRYYVPPIVRAE